MPDFGSMDVLGAWISIFLTLFILSFLYEDNPIYKLGEHIFLGVSIGYAVVEVYFGVFKPNLLDKLFFADEWTYERPFLIVPLILTALLFMKYSKKHGWLARLPIAFVVAAYAGVKLTGELRAHLMTSVQQSMPDFRRLWAENLEVGKETTLRVYEFGTGWVDTTVVGTCEDGATWYGGLWCWTNDGAGVISGVVLVVGLTACLLHFYFSAPHNRVMTNVSRVGILVLMLSFGASFGYTVMGRISLAIGRAQEMLGLDKSAELVAARNPQMATVVAFVFVVGFLAVWKARGGGGDPEPPPPE
ncbi:MAG: hypothetical protein GY898_26505 [Proteobacteria bacterium]|nr:hypothetical protein [Pseudomonadota bacterium]